MKPSSAANWLGQLIVPRLRLTDDVLDVGCGLMHPTGGRLKTYSHVGIDSYKPYLERIGPPTIHGTLPQAIEDLEPAFTFDVVLLLDVVEHLTKPDALRVIAAAERLACREVILFTPDGFCPQSAWDAWDMGVNDGQAHRCGFTFAELAGMGYECSRHRNGTQQGGAITSVLGFKCLTPPSR